MKGDGLPQGELCGILKGIYIAIGHNTCSASLISSVDLKGILTQHKMCVTVAKLGTIPFPLSFIPYFTVFIVIVRTRITFLIFKAVPQLAQLELSEAFIAQG